VKSRARRALAGCLVSFALAAPAAADVARGDAAYAERGLGAAAGRAEPEPIGSAVRAYQAALAREPERFEARWKLLRALYFEGDFATADPAAKKALFERATALAEESLALFEARVGEGLAELPEAALRAKVEAAGLSPSDAAALHFWSAVAWGVWSQSHGLLDAVRKGVARRIYDEASVAHRLDPDLELGGPLRLLARLHAKLPHVPFVSGFVDRSLAEPLAAEAVQRWPTHPGNRYLLALTWLDLAPDRRSDALRLLREVAAWSPRASQRVEDAAVASAARERLAQESGPSLGG
jgi:tetratricopeptide (TPR) repeat protein